MNPAWELLSIVAEVVAFFFVTVDLYGEPRLLLLQTRISTVLSFLLNRLRFFDNPDDKPWTGVGSPVAMAFRCLVAIGCYYLIPVLESHIEGNSPSGERVAYGILLILSILILFSNVLLILLDLIRLIPTIALWLLGRAELKGILLSVGAVLFVFAKGIQAVKPLRELHLPFKLPFV